MREHRPQAQMMATQHSQAWLQAAVSRHSKCRAVDAVGSTLKSVERKQMTPVLPVKDQLVHDFSSALLCTHRSGCRHIYY